MKPGAQRLPDFIIIGTMKSGSTTLFRWLEQQPECWLPALKEPNFFSHDRTWRRGLDWYAGIFAPAGAAPLTGEASVSYTNPAWAAHAAQRIATTVPDARLICLLRHPIERLRSHYRHEVQRNRERRPLVAALREPGNAYVEQSRYCSALTPYLDRFPRSQLCLVRFEDLRGEPPPAWAEVLAHLGLPDRPPPGEAHNVTAEKAQFTTPLRWLWKAGLTRYASVLPQPLRQLGRRTLMRDGPAFQAQLQESLVDIPDELVAPVWEDVDRLAERLGQPLWQR